jgi:4-azaleucine resistance transporter AzlC
MEDSGQNTRPQAAAPQNRFDLTGALSGAKGVIPLALSAATYGLAFGVLAQKTGLSSGEILLMSGLVFAGASQFVALDMWIQPLDFWALVITTFVVNLRHLLMGAAIRPYFTGLSPLKAYGSVFFMADENWALSMDRLNRGRDNAAVLIGSGLMLYAVWLGSTWAGGLAATWVTDPARWGIDFAFTAAFVALMVSMWRGKGDLAPWLVAALVSTAAAQVLPGKWYILIGGLAGSLFGMVRDGR